MKTTRLSRSLMLIAATGIAVLMAVPFGAAAPTLNVETPTYSKAPLAPETGQVDVSIKYTYQVDNAVVKLAGFAKSSVDVIFRFDCDDGVTISGSTSQTLSVDFEASASTTFSNTAAFIASVTRQAPGLQQLNCDVYVKVSELFSPGAEEVTESLRTKFVVTADYFPLISSNVAGKVKDSGPRKNVGFDITVSNFGNAKTQVAFEVLSKPGGKRWQVLTPDPLILDSPNVGTGTSSGTARLSIATTYKNGWNNEQGAVQMRMTARAAEDQSNDNQMDIQSNMLVRIRGVYVPGFEPVALLGAVLAAGMLARMRNRDEDQE